MKVTIATAALVLAVPSALPARAAVVPPPIVQSDRAGGYQPPQEVLVTWRPGSATCGGSTVPAVRAPAPRASMGWSSVNVPSTITYEFRIDASGRPLGIRRAAKDYVPDSSDVAPALAVSRFGAGAERGPCSITFAALRSPVAQAAPSDLMAFTVFPIGTVPPAVWQRLKPVGSTCVDPPPAVLLRAYPDFKKLSNQPGEARWSMVGFDIAKTGKPVRVRTIGGSASPALDRASLDAAARSRFEAGARQGCFFPYRQHAATLEAPEGPTALSMRPPEATCPAGPGTDSRWVKQPQLVYPDDFRRRSVEGWALIAFDVAPWGATGNARVLAAEPAAEFGEAGLKVILNSARAPSSSGYTGCVERVRYVLRPRVPVSVPAPGIIN